MGVREEIDEAEQAWRRAVLARDEPALQNLLHEDFQLVGIRSTGVSAFPRQIWFDALRRMNIRALEVEVTGLTPLDGIAIATVEGTWTLEMDGRPIDERFLLTDVWLRTPAGWQVVRRHSSPYPKTG
ncbi:MAG TPA: nuclear transport factor 2 family protein [Allosphingosinicella sp.]|jgi:ketosteroid isomerase-like protein|nr:nuclear transport factor 2 family protein [Allosphingosinicella sp.]